MPPKKTRIIGIDYGLKRIGIAISDELKIIATPVKTLVTDKKLAHTILLVKNELQRLSAEKNCLIEQIIVGNPLRMNGQVGLQADEVKLFVEELKLLIECPIILWDERLTTVQADRSLREAELNRKKRSSVVDTVAAALILQSYLDSRSFLLETPIGD